MPDQFRGTRPTDLEMERGISGELRPPTPMEELEMMDLRVELAAQDEEMAMFDPDTHPKPPRLREEAVRSFDGRREVDMMLDTPAVEDVIGNFDLSDDDLRAFDIRF